MTRKPAAAVLTLVLAACGGASHSASTHRSATADLVLVQASYGPARYSKVGAPIDALTVSGTISNKGSAALACDLGAFIVTDASGASFTPVSASCQVPQIAPGGVSSFSATFRTPLRARMELHYEHGDGTFEQRDLHLRP